MHFLLLNGLLQINSIHFFSFLNCLNISHLPCVSKYMQKINMDKMNWSLYNSDFPEICLANTWNGFHGNTKNTAAMQMKCITKQVPVYTERSKEIKGQEFILIGYNIRPGVIVDINCDRWNPFTKLAYWQKACFLMQICLVCREACNS